MRGLNLTVVPIGAGCMLVAPVAVAPKGAVVVPYRAPKSDCELLAEVLVPPKIEEDVPPNGPKETKNMKLNHF